MQKESQQTLNQFLVKFNSRWNSQQEKEIKFFSTQPPSSITKDKNLQSNNSSLIEKLQTSQMIRSSDFIQENILTPKRKSHSNFDKKSPQVSTINLLDLMKRNEQAQENSRNRQFSVNDQEQNMSNQKFQNQREPSNNIDRMSQMYQITNPSNRDMGSGRKYLGKPQAPNKSLSDLKFKIFLDSNYVTKPVVQSPIKRVTSIDSRTNVKIDTNQTNSKIKQVLSTINSLRQDNEDNKFVQDQLMKSLMKTENPKESVQKDKHNLKLNLFSSKEDLSNQQAQRKPSVYEVYPNIQNIMSTHKTQVQDLTEQVNGLQSQISELKLTIKKERIKFRYSEKQFQQNLLGLQAIIGQKTKDFDSLCQNHKREINLLIEQKQYTENSRLHTYTNNIDNSVLENTSPRFMLFQLYEIANILNLDNSSQQLSATSVGSSLYEQNTIQQKKIFTAIEQIKNGAIRLSKSSLVSQSIQKLKRNGSQQIINPDSIPIPIVLQMDELRNQISKLKILNKQQSNKILKMEIDGDVQKIKIDQETQIDNTKNDTLELITFKNQLKLLQDSLKENEENQYELRVELNQKNEQILESEQNQWNLAEKNSRLVQELEKTKDSVDMRIKSLLSSLTQLKVDKTSIKKICQDNSNLMKKSVNFIVLELKSEYEKVILQMKYQMEHQIDQNKLTQNDRKSLQQDLFSQEQLTLETSQSNQEVFNTYFQQIEDLRIQLFSHQKNINIYLSQIGQYIQQEEQQNISSKLMELQIDEKQHQNSLLLQKIADFESYIVQLKEQQILITEQEDLQFSILQQNLDISAQQSQKEFQESQSLINSQCQEITFLKIQLHDTMDQLKTIEKNKEHQQRKYSELKEISQAYETENSTLREGLEVKVQDFNNLQLKYIGDCQMSSEKIKVLIQDKIQLEQKIFDQIEVNTKRSVTLTAQSAKARQSSVQDYQQILDDEQLFNSNISYIFEQKGTEQTHEIIQNNQVRVEEEEDEHKIIILKYTELLNQNLSLISTLDELKIELEERELNENKLVSKIKSLSDQIKEKDQVIQCSDWKQNLGHTKTVLLRFLENIHSTKKEVGELNLNILFSLFEYNAEEKEQIQLILKSNIERQRSPTGFLKLFK